MTIALALLIALQPYSPTVCPGYAEPTCPTQPAPWLWCDWDPVYQSYSDCRAVE